MVNHTYQIQYHKGDSNSVNSSNVIATSEHEAKEKLKSQGSTQKIRIISCVKLG